MTSGRVHDDFRRRSNVDAMTGLSPPVSLPDPEARGGLKRPLCSAFKARATSGGAAATPSTADLSAAWRAA